MLVKSKPAPQSAVNTDSSSQEQAVDRKEERAQKRKADRLRKELISFTTSVCFAAAFVGLLLGLVGGIKVAAAGTLGILILALSFKYPRQALWGFLIYMPFGGTITYAIGNSPLLQLAKDGFYLPALVGIVQYCKREKLSILVPKQLIAPLSILLFFCGLTLLSVNGFQQFFGKAGEKPIAMGILGLKVLLGYIPLVVCAYYLIRTKKDLLLLMRLTSVVFLICCGLAFVQYLMLLTGKCAGTRFEAGNDLFKASLEARCFVGGSLLYSPQQGVIRLPGTFVAPWQWGWFLISGAFLTFASAFSDPKPLWRILGLLSLGAVFILAVVSGQRIALALVPVIAAALLVLTGQVTNLKRFIPIAVGLGVVLSVAALQNPDTLQERLDSFISRWNASPPYAFIVEQFSWAMEGYNVLGHGIGRATNSARVFGETALIETYYPKLIYEIGPLGTLAFLGFVTTLTRLVFKTTKKLRDRNFRSYGAALCWFILFISYNTYYYPLDVDPVAIYYWFFAGVALKLPEIERLAKIEAVEAEPLPQRKGKKNQKKQKKKNQKKAKQKRKRK